MAVLCMCKSRPVSRSWRSGLAATRMTPAHRMTRAATYLLANSSVPSWAAAPGARVPDHGTAYQAFPAVGACFIGIFFRFAASATNLHRSRNPNR